MTTKPITEEDIARLVPAFYSRVRADEVLGPIFNEAIEDWPHHLEKLQAFWSSIMLTSGRYKGQPMIALYASRAAYYAGELRPRLELWRETSDELLGPQSAAALQEKAGRIAESLQLGVQFYRDRRAG